VPALAVTIVVPGSIETRTGGTIYDRRIAEGLRSRGWDVALVELDPVPHPLQPPLDTARARFAAIPDHSLVLIDGLAFGTMPELAEQHGCRLRFVAIVHMALATTPGLLPGEVGWLSNLERRALDHARHVVITGQRTAPFVRSLSGRLTDAQVTVISPGTDRPDRTALAPPPAARRSPGRPRVAGPAVRAPRAGSRDVAHRGDELRLLCVANLTPGKGHDILFRALARVPGTGWKLTCAGSLNRDLSYADRVSRLARELGIDDRITLAGELDDDDLAREYARADLCVLATRGETYGMAVADAIAHGLPVVSTLTGEIPAIVGDGGLLAAPGDDAAFAEQLLAAMTSREAIGRLSAGARAAAARLPTWEDAVTQMAGVLDNVQR
jgi:glycosyltransferase involved in cell wall biosynthesis